MRRQPASLLAEKPDMLMLKFLAFGWYSVNAIVKLKPFGFLFSIDIVVSVKSLHTKPSGKVKMSIENKMQNGF